MSMYLSNPDVRPIGVEPAEFIDFPTVNDERDLPATRTPATRTHGAKSSACTPGPFTSYTGETVQPPCPFARRWLRRHFDEALRS